MQVIFLDIQLVSKKYR